MARKLSIGVFVFLLFAANQLTAQTVALDYYFNHESRKTKSGGTERFHYTWEDETNSGFSIWGSIFKSNGAKLTGLDAAPTMQTLKDAAVYIIVDPDNKKENANPNYISAADADEIDSWVKAGGVLILMANDSANTELKNFNVLAACFGMHFNNDMQNHVINDEHFEDGAVPLNNNFIFKTAKKVFLKDVCSIELKGKARAVFTSPAGKAIAAIARHGKGTVIAVGDPWLYNEYVNGRLPAGFENDKAAADLAKYALSLAKKTRGGVY